MYGERGDGKGEKMVGRNCSAEGDIYVKSVNGDCLLNSAVRRGQSILNNRAA